jgi:hypothetical protein
VVVKVRFDGEATEMLGLENHVCEVQLLLRQIVDPRVRGIAGIADDQSYQPCKNMKSSSAAHLQNGLFKI